jgi:serine/threonine-protein kinase
MPATVTLSVTRGKLQGQRFILAERTTCIMGRADDCQPQLPNDDDHKTISRHHCLLDINPPDVRVRDFGSLNGTFVNGQKIGQRGRGQTPEEGARLVFPEHDLKHGDQIELGNTVFQVRVFVPAVCADCSGEIPEAEKGQAERTPGVYQCEACRQKAEASWATAPPRNKDRTCARCGRDITREVNAERPGDFVCAACKADPLQIVRHLLELARSGAADLRGLHGYKIMRELGHGGMGAVYLAQDEQSGEQVALKVMLPRVAADARARTMFLREAENTKALRHPNVVELRDGGCWRGTFFFTLEYCDGGSVDRLIKERGGRLALDEAGPIILQVLDGLDYAHNAPIPHVRLADGSDGPGRGLVHRDIKPHNLFLAGSGGARVAKVGDYGLAKAFDLAGLSGQTRTGSVAGTPVFMPRQQVVNFKYAKPEVDVWAVAASLYFMLTGAFPRDFPRGKDPWQVVLQTQPVPIRRREPALPAKLAEVIDLALVDQPSISFRSAADFKQALAAVL